MHFPSTSSKRSLQSLQVFFLLHFKQFLGQSSQEVPFQNFSSSQLQVLLMKFNPSLQVRQEFSPFASQVSHELWHLKHLKGED
jgi:hypothetical protein